MPAKVQKVVAGRRTLHTLKKPTPTIVKKEKKEKAPKVAATTGCSHCYKKVSNFITKYASKTTPPCAADEYPGFTIQDSTLEEWIEALTKEVKLNKRRKNAQAWNAKHAESVNWAAAELKASLEKHRKNFTPYDSDEEDTDSDSDVEEDSDSDMEEDSDSDSDSERECGCKWNECCDLCVDDE